MSELVNRITELERKVNEAEEAHKTADRLWDAAEEALDDIRSLALSLFELSSAIDGYIADNDYPAVQQAAYEIRGTTDAGRLLPLVRRAMLLQALRDGSALPTLGALEAVPELPPSEVDHPVLSWEELMRDSTQELKAHEEKLRSIWRGAEDDYELEDGLHEARLDAASDRAVRAGRQLMALCEYLSEELCPALVHSTERLCAADALRALAAIDIAGKEAPSAYKVYEAALSEQYERSPASLGEMGEHLMLFEAWIHSQ